MAGDFSGVFVNSYKVPLCPSNVIRPPGRQLLQPAEQESNCTSIVVSVQPDQTKDGGGLLVAWPAAAGFRRAARPFRALGVPIAPNWSAEWRRAYGGAPGIVSF